MLVFPFQTNAVCFVYSRYFIQFSTLQRFAIGDIMVTTFYVTCLIGKTIFISNLHLFALSHYFLVLLVGSASAYSEQCAIGPEYWCKSFENAQDCGAVYHCTSTVWAYDNKYTETDSSTSCQWCERVLENTNKALEQIGDNQVRHVYKNHV